MSIVLCPSVKHCGHHFMRHRIFEPLGYVATPPDQLSAAIFDRVDKIVAMGHYEDTRNFNRLWRLLGGSAAVYVPLRHPARVLESCNRKGVLNSDYAVFHAQWSAMMHSVPFFREVYWLHLDEPNIRYLQADRILQSLEALPDFTVDWTVNEESGAKSGTHDLVLTEELLAKVPKGFIQFYYETMEV